MSGALTSGSLGCQSFSRRSDAVWSAFESLKVAKCEGLLAAAETDELEDGGRLEAGGLRLGLGFRLGGGGGDGAGVHPDQSKGCAADAVGQ